MLARGGPRPILLTTACVAATLTLSACGGVADTATGSSPPATATSESLSPSATDQVLEAAGAAETAVPLIVSTFCTSGGLGSGFFIDSTHVMTAGHVVEQATSIVVKVDGKDRPARVIGFNSRADLAMLELGSGSFSGTPLALADADPVVGAAVAAVGYPEGGSLTSTRGKVTDTGASVTVQDGVRRTRMVKTDALVSPGNSGGPLIGIDGRVDGVVHAGSRYDTEYGWAVSPVVTSDFARAWLKQPKRFLAPSCSSPGDGWLDSGPATASAGYAFVGPPKYDACINPAYPIDSGLSVKTRSPAGSAADWTVRSVQTGLRALGYGLSDVVVDGDYGPKTASAVGAFQRAEGLGVDGVVGQQTWDALHRSLKELPGACS